MKRRLAAAADAAAAAARQRRKKTRRGVPKPEKRLRFLWRGVVDGLSNVRVSMTEGRMNRAHRKSHRTSKEKGGRGVLADSGGQTPSSSEPTPRPGKATAVLGARFTARVCTSLCFVRKPQRLAVKRARRRLLRCCVGRGVSRVALCFFLGGVLLSSSVCPALTRRP